MPRAKSSRHNIGVIGTINRDTIYRADGSTVTSWGGLLYNLKCLAENGSATVIPAVNAGNDCYCQIIAILKRFPRVDRSLVQPVEAVNNHCFLHYADQAHKCEMLAGGVPPLIWCRVKPLTQTDLILVNFISGRDIGLAALEKLRRSYTGPIYMDIHSLTLGRKKVPGGCHRFLRRPRHWARYVACADILQMNRVEFELLSGRPLSEDHAIVFVKRHLPKTRCLVVTMGGKGALVVRHINKRLRAVHVPVREVKKPYDTTGCGDIFAAGLILEYLSSQDVLKAARRGNRLAAARCRIPGPVF
ncbi:MAG: carbohydrate kinase family protein [candidate division Zixibacteria bacterium]|nr:carbohydrate kinase family protein [candidate division Zixibacteria bacterium]